jgi:hypothetical protein
MKQLHTLFTLPKVNRQESFSPNEQLWENIKVKLLDKYGEFIFNRYMKNTEFGAVEEGNQVVILAGMSFQAKELAQHYAPVIYDFLIEVIPKMQSLRFDIYFQYKRDEEEKQKAEQAIITKEVALKASLPQWADSVRGVPNGILRGSLFAAIQGKHRRAMQRELIVDEKNLKIKFTGIQLDQSDLDVWEQILHLARQDNLGKVVTFNAHSLLKSLNRNTGKSQYEWLEDVMARLMGCGIEISHDNKTCGRKLLEYDREDITGEYKVCVNPQIARLYDMGYWTQINWDDRLKIGNKPLALWLHGFIASHAEPFPMKVETYHRLSGSNNKCMRDFKRKLQESLQELLDLKLIASFRFEKDLVHIKNNPSNSQKKHLENKNKHGIRGTQ